MYNKLEYYISQPRLNRYLIASENSKDKALLLYQANLKVTQSFYPVINLFEVFLRNICNYQLSSAFEDSDWIITEKNGFMNNPSLRSTKYFLRNSVINAEKKISRTGGAVTANKIIAEQSFGFWTSLFEPHHYRLVKGAVIHAFPNKPEMINRSIISQMLIHIREFRNRIYHNEPICFKHNSFDFHYADRIKHEIYNLFEWMDTEIPTYIRSFDTIDSRINSANKIISKSE